LQRWVAFDPRKRLADRLPAEAVVACNDHFDERYVDRSRVYREFLIFDGGDILWARESWASAM